MNEDLIYKRIKAIKPIISGQKVTCLVCGKGYYKQVEKSNIYRCSECGDKLTVNYQKKSAP